MPEAREPSSTNTITEAITRVLKESSLATLVTLIGPQSSTGAKILVEENGDRVGSLGDAALDEAAMRCVASFVISHADAGTFMLRDYATGPSELPDSRVLCERIEPEPRLIICGAGHVGASLARLARILGYGIVLIDDRADFVTRDRFPDEGIKLVVAESWTDALVREMGAGRSVFVAVVTRGHNEDEECLRAVVGVRPDYVGLIGSRRRTNIVIDRLRDSGADESILREVRAPIGLDIGAVAPEEVALAILAEIVLFRRGGTGAQLSSWRRTETRDQK
jgi:xanthine dehydrogenase accessory factor